MNTVGDLLTFLKTLDQDLPIRIRTERADHVLAGAWDTTVDRPNGELTCILDLGEQEVEAERKETVGDPVQFHAYIEAVHFPGDEEKENWVRFNVPAQFTAEGVFLLRMRGCLIRVTCQALANDTIGKRVEE